MDHQLRQDESEKFLASFVMFDWQGLSDRDRRRESFFAERGEFLQELGMPRSTFFQSRNYNQPWDFEVPSGKLT